MNVGHILSVKGSEVYTLDAKATLAETVSVLAERRIGAIVLVDGRGGVAGIISERDIVRVLAKSGAEVLDKPVGEAMTVKVKTCGLETPIDDLLATMTKGRFRHLPVVENGRLVGLVSIGDIVKNKIEQAERDAEKMREYIAAG
ncbi:CBS domain-containing protein [Jiella sp. MQZ9-1]|uniref:CBS domain-containing protein n=1 Tax=Jiella flava TaxID=2816857 RepID=A0A939FXN2_9HYPH|nr:CBS domain-containing protein [Jiella flava]MBO0663405.1 CBS domain-containing protein [Jiella flava]MCD2471981.1 CBS domain-containing protein [Jiella flava]